MGCEVTIHDALAVYGPGYTVSLFAVMRPDSTPALEFTVDETTPREVRSFNLEDDYHVLARFRMIEYDIELDHLPDPLGSYLEGCLRIACCGGAVAAWLGFEGSFSFEHLLTSDSADKLYGLCGPDQPPRVVLDLRELDSDAWRSAVTQLRRALTGS